MAIELPGPVRAINEDVAYVSRIAAGEWTLRNVDAGLLDRLPGAVEQRGPHFVLQVADGDVELARTAETLRSLGVLFSFGWGWSPAEVLEDLRDRGFLQGPVPIISWRGPGHAEAYER